jgi:hypothetical protein
MFIIELGMLGKHSFELVPYVSNNAVRLSFLLI